MIARSRREISSKAEKAGSRANICALGDQMKIRSGFVSNSSSSSFVLAMDKDVNSVEKLQRKLFGLAKYYHGLYGEAIESNILAHIIWHDMCEASAHYAYEGQWAEYTRNEIAEAFVNGDLPGADRIKGPSPIGRYKNQKSLDKAWETYHNRLYKIARKVSDEFLDKHVDSAIYMLKYSDHYAIGAAIEDGDVFKNIPHVKDSHH